MHEHPIDGHAPLAYQNEAFLNTPDARTLRILAEYIEPQSRLRRENIQDTVVFFGSARILSRDAAQAAVVAARQAPSDAAILRSAEAALVMSEYYEGARELARLLTEWAMTLPSRRRRFVISS